MEKSKHKEKVSISLLIVFGTILLALIIGSMTTFLSLELDLIDFRFKIRGPLNVEDSPIIILAIDDQSDESTPHR